MCKPHKCAEKPVAKKKRRRRRRLDVDKSLELYRRRITRSPLRHELHELDEMRKKQLSRTRTTSPHWALMSSPFATALPRMLGARRWVGERCLVG